MWSISRTRPWQTLLEYYHCVWDQQLWLDFHLCLWNAIQLLVTPHRVFAGVFMFPILICIVYSVLFHKHDSVFCACTGLWKRQEEISTWLPSILCSGIFNCLASTARGLPSIPVMILPPRSAAAAMSGPYTHDHVILSNHTFWSILSSSPETDYDLRKARTSPKLKVQCGYRSSMVWSTHDKSRQPEGWE